MALAMSFTSCIRENLDQCPPLRINIEVKDKNYFNVDQAAPEEKRDENQPFRSFIPTLSYCLSRLNDDGTQQVIVEEKGFEVEGDGFGRDLVYSRHIWQFRQHQARSLLQPEAGGDQNIREERIACTIAAAPGRIF